MNNGSEPESRIAAFFDLDGTLIPEPTLEQRFFEGLRKSGVIPWANYLLWCIGALRLLPKGITTLVHTNKAYLRGVGTQRALQQIETVMFFEEGIDRVAWHARQGHEIVLITGTLQPLAQIVATTLECELEWRGVECHTRVCATRLEEGRGHWTGRVIGDAMYGEAKSRAVLQMARKRQFDLALCHAYGNTPLDRRMLSAVGRAHAVNPGKELAATANLRDWPIWHWHVEKEVSSPGLPQLKTKIDFAESQL
jgi:phosphoserine phosphatase